MKDQITILLIHPNGQVEKEKKCEIKDGTVIIADGQGYEIKPFEILLRGKSPYAILLEGKGFLWIGCK